MSQTPEYERARTANIAFNQKRLESIGIFRSEAANTISIRKSKAQSQKPEAKVVTEKRHNPDRECKQQAVVDIPDERKQHKTERKMPEAAKDATSKLTVYDFISVHDFITSHCDVDPIMSDELTSKLIDSKTDTSLLYTIYTAKMAHSMDEQVAIDEVVKTVSRTTANAIGYSGQLKIAYGVKNMYDLR
jgi:hypothetical protein